MSRRVRIIVEESGQPIKEYSITTDLKPWQIVSEINQVLDNLAIREEGLRKATEIVEDMYEHPEKYGFKPLPNSRAFQTSEGDVIIPRPLPTGKVKYERLLVRKEIEKLDEEMKKRGRLDTVQVAKLLGIGLGRAEIKLIYYAKLRGYVYDRGEVYPE